MLHVFGSLDELERVGVPAVFVVFDPEFSDQNKLFSSFNYCFMVDFT